MKHFVFDIADKSYEKYLQQGSLQIVDNINKRSNATFNLIGNYQNFEIEPSSEVDIKIYFLDKEDWGWVFDYVEETDDFGYITEPANETLDFDITGKDNISFSGFVDNLNIVKLNQNNDILLYQIQCVDNHLIFDRRYVAESFEKKSVSYIINFILNKYFNEDGIIISQIDSGNTIIEEAVFNYIKASDCISQLAEKTGCIWWIDDERRFYFVYRESEYVDWELNENCEIKALTFNSHKQKYRNKQIVRGAKIETSLLTQTFKTDGEIQSFVLSYPPIYEPKVYVNNVAKTVGIRGVDTGKDFYWSKNDKVINSEIKYSSGNIVKIEYIGVFDIVVDISNYDEINRIKELEDTSGIYEDVENLKGLKTLDGVIEETRNLIDTYSNFGKTISFITDKKIYAGQIMRCYLPKFNFYDEILITEVTIKEIIKDKFIYQVQGVTNEAVGGWVEFFKKYFKKDTGEPISLISSGENIIYPLSYTKNNWTLTPPNSIFYVLYPSNSLYPSNNLYPCFDNRDKMEYVDVLINGVASLRKRFIKQIFGNNRITTIYMINADEAIGNITGFKFYSGVSASMTIGSGTCFDTRNYTKEKTKRDIIIITRTDILGG